MVPRCAREDIKVSETAKISLNGADYELPITTGSEGEIGIEVSSFRGQSGAITLDPGYGSTGSCTSGVTFLNGEKGILRYRGYPIEQLAEKSTFLERQALTARPTTTQCLNGDFKHV